MDQSDKHIGENAKAMTRRTFVVVASGAALALLGAGALNALASDGGGGGGSEGGQGGIITGEYNTGFIWFDEGGFADQGAKEPTQGWNDASKTYFFDLMVKYVGLPFDYNAVNGGTPSYNFYSTAADQALSRARARSKNDKARIVGVGWAYTNPTYSGVIQKDKWCFARNATGWATFENLIPRQGNDKELLASAGWDTAVQGDGRSWRQYIYEIGKQDNPSDQYMCVVVAVADDEPQAMGKGTLNKKAQFETWR